MSEYAPAFPKPTRAERDKTRRTRGRNDRRNPSPLRPVPFRSEEYRAFVRLHPCSIEGRNGHACYVEFDMDEAGNEVKRYVIDAAHIEGNGMGTKADDTMTIPLCRGAHLYQHTTTWDRFEKKYEINRYEIAARLLSEWVRRMTIKGGLR